MSGYGPAPARARELARRSGCVIKSQQPLRDGGTAYRISCRDHRAKLRLLAALADDDALHPDVRRLAESVVAGARSTDEQIRRLHAYVRDSVTFTREPQETFSHTLRTLDVGLGDCDDSARALMALLRSLGIHAGLLTLPESPTATPVHVAAAVRTDKEGWRWLETSVRAEPYEHPIAAARRLGIRTRAELGSLGDVADDGYLFRAGMAYVVGFDKPTIISLERIREGVEDRGFHVEGVWPRAAFPGFPFPLPPHDDSWDFVAVVRRTAGDEAIELPSRVCWIVDVASGAVAVPIRASSRRRRMALAALGGLGIGALAARLW